MHGDDVGVLMLMWWRELYHVLRQNALTIVMIKNGDNKSGNNKCYSYANLYDKIEDTLDIDCCKSENVSLSLIFLLKGL